MPAFRMIRCASMIWAPAAQSDLKDAGGEDLAVNQESKNMLSLGLSKLRQPDQAASLPLSKPWHQE
jgi:hypothetical protein